MNEKKKMKNIRKSSAGQHYLTFVSRETGEIMMGRFLPWSTSLLIINGSKKQKIKVKNKYYEIQVPNFIFGKISNYSLFFNDTIINCNELWQ